MQRSKKTNPLRLWNLRESRFIQRCAEQCRGIPPSAKPTLHPSDVSIISTTINTPDDFTEAIRTWIAAQPKEIILVTIERDEPRLRELLAPVLGEPLGDVQITVLIAPRANKRVQMDIGIGAARSSILGFVDDCVRWKQPAAIIPLFLAALEDPGVGGAVGRQRQVPTSDLYLR